MKNKELIIGAAVASILLFSGVVKAILQPEHSSESVAAVQNEATTRGSEQDSAITKAREKVEAEKKRKALEEIAGHETAIINNWSAKDTPDRLMGVGNLYQYQLDDYYSAIERYRMLVDSFPNHSKTAQAYIEIAACFEKLGEPTQAKYVYREMIESLDPSLQHVQYAKLKLAGG